jgi:hypothetical protein
MTRGMEWTANLRSASMAPPTVRITMGWLMRLALCLSFLCSFAQYSVSFAVAALVPLVGIAFCALLVLCGRERAHRVQHILGGGGLLFAAMLFGEAVSYTSRDTYSEMYGLVFIGIFLCARLILQEIGIANVMRAYSQAAILAVCLVLITGRQTLFAGQGTRFSGGTRAHPNLLAFILAGFFPIIVWRAMEETSKWKKRALIVLSMAAFTMLFVTGSRGSLSAVLAAGLALLLRSVAGGRLLKVRLRHLHIILLVILIPLAVAFLLHRNRIGGITDYLVDFLAVHNSQRGLQSGLSGRTDIWQIAFRLLRTRGRWLFGFGYRAGERMVGTIDDGYVQLLFESGLVAGGLILGSMLRVFFLLWKPSNPRVNTPWTRFYMMLWCLMIVYFLNNISTRYLFSYGSPFSLCVLFLMSASRRELVGGAPQAPAGRGGMQPDSPRLNRSDTLSKLWNAGGQGLY